MIAYESIYLDTSPLIYFLQNSERYFPVMKQFFREAFYRNAIFKTSVITVEEFLVYPYKAGRMELKRNFYEWLDRAEIELLPITTSIADRAAEIRGKYCGFKGMDALQLASFQKSGCEVFLTNDKQLMQFDEKRIVLVDNLRIHAIKGEK